MCIYRASFSIEQSLIIIPRYLPLIHPAHSIHWIWHNSCIILRSSTCASTFYFIFRCFDSFFVISHFILFACLFLFPCALQRAGRLLCFCVYRRIFANKKHTHKMLINMWRCCEIRHLCVHCAHFSFAIYIRKCIELNTKKYLNHTHAWKDDPGQIEIWIAA